MVLVEFFELKLEQSGSISELLMDIDILGYVPEDPVKGVEMLTKAFKKLRFGYLNRQYWVTDLGKIGYFIAEISRDKIYLTTVPENTYNYESCMKSWSSDSCKPIYMFIDVGSPFRHIILVSEWETEEDYPPSKSFIITGLGYFEYYKLWVTFRSADWIVLNCTASFCTEKYIETVERLASDKEIYFTVYPRADEKTKRIFKNIINAVANTKSKQTTSSTKTG